MASSNKISSLIMCWPSSLALRRTEQRKLEVKADTATFLSPEGQVRVGTDPSKTLVEMPLLFMSIVLKIYMM
jgi:hypothetical protein